MGALVSFQTLRLRRLRRARELRRKRFWEAHIRCVEAWARVARGDFDIEWKFVGNVLPQKRVAGE